MKTMTTPTVICRIVIPLCTSCQRLHVETAREELTTCDAFPAGIPDAIYADGEIHFDPYPGDNGLQFLPLPGFEDTEANWRDPVRMDYQRQYLEKMKEACGLDDDMMRERLGESEYRRFFPPPANRSEDDNEFTLD